MPLAGKVVVVTGGSRGIGKGIAIELARGGASVVIAGRTETPEQGPAPGTIWQTLEEIKALHAAKAIAVRCDVTKEDEVANLMQRAASAFGHINALVNNAGAAFRTGTLRDIPLSRWYEIINVNVTGVFLCCRFVLPHMISQGGGSIVNISSGAAASAGPRGGIAYGTSKAALERFTLLLAAELKEYNIAVNA